VTGDNWTVRDWFHRNQRSASEFRADDHLSPIWSVASAMESLSELAARWGIELEYHDVHGGHHRAADHVLDRVVKALAGPGLQPAAYPEAPAQPLLAHQGDGRRKWILAVQLYGVRSSRNWGHGDFTDLANLLRIVAKLGGSGIGLNPLHALFYDTPGTGSPYSPSSRYFLNPLYVDVEAIAEFRPGETNIASELDALRHSELVDYVAVARVKLTALRAAYRVFLTEGDPQRRADFESYRRESGRELALFAAFETLRGLHRGTWYEWPPEWREPNGDIIERLSATHAEEMGFHEYLQWNASRQLEHCRDVARQLRMPIGLYLDTAVGVDPNGADVWMERSTMLQGLSVGAPPDQYNPAGQDWGLATYNPHGLVTSKFEPFRQMLRAAMRYSGATRIDHVLGLMRLFVIPHGLSARDGVYLRFPFSAMLEIVAEESQRWECIVIGEDLGTVPENFRANMDRWGLWRYLVVLFERNADGSFRAPSDYPERAIATFNTHDLPTFSGWMSGHDLRTKRDIGVDPGESDEDRERSRAALRAAAGMHQGFEDVVAFLAATPTRLVSIVIEDVFGAEDQTNVPGTVDQYPNWRHRWPVPIEILENDERFQRIAATLARAGRSAETAG
jgi:4-alpha-glucanotransferase